ncbi:MAG TPA: DUF6134 family protein [Niastella sp.]|nr:DUF6134 family protein [Niastella sp.]
MLPSLIFLLLRRYQQKHPENAKLLFSRLRFAARIGLLLLLTVCMALYARAQVLVLQYQVSRGSALVGTLVVQESKQNGQVRYKLQSAIQTSFLFTITGKVIEEAVYENGILIYARMYQKLNNKEQVNTEIKAQGNRYHVTSRAVTKPLNNYPITYNLVCLYTVEPLHRTTVFVEKFQRFVPIETLGPHQYKVTFPDGAYNEYYYKAGICIKVKVSTTWFRAEMNLKS